MNGDVGALPLGTFVVVSVFFITGLLTLVCYMVYDLWKYRKPRVTFTTTTDTTPEDFSGGGGTVR